MRERGIIFNAEMVRAVLEGRKTQTRRVCTEIDPSNFPGCLSKRQWAKVNNALPVAFGPDDFCPFGSVGDRLWVRETWMPDAPRDGTWGDVEFYGCKGSPLSMIPKRFRKPEHCIHRATWDGSEMVGWTPSIHMPRWASRITLEITGVRVERLYAITLGDICKEFGCGLYDFRPATYGFQAWEELWKSIYGEESWQANPWVWVIEFKRVEGVHVQTS